MLPTSAKQARQPLPVEEPKKLPAKAAKLPQGMAALKISVPQETAAWYRARAAREGIAVQAITAPLLNAFARGEIKQEFTKLAAELGH